MNNEIQLTTDDAEYYFKDIGLSKKAADYEKIDSAGFPINVIITERMARVKTYGAKYHAYKKWVESGKIGQNTLFLRNLVDDIDLELGRFLDDVHPDMQELVTKVERGDMFLQDKDGKKFMTLAPVSTPRTLRGSRRYLKYIIWDEFNDSVRYLGEDIVSNFLNILSSTSKQLKPGEKNPRISYILGNNRTLNHPLFISLGIATIDKEVTKIYDDNGNPFMLIIFPIIKPEEIQAMETERVNDWEYQLAKRTGMAEHMYHNKSQFDDVNWVYTYFDFSYKSIIKNFLNGSTASITNTLDLSATFRDGTQYLNIYNIPYKSQNTLKTKYHVINVTLLVNELRRNKAHIEVNQLLSKNKKGEKLVHISNAKNQQTGEVLISSANITSMRDLIAANKISFENESSKNLFYKILNKK